MELCRLSNRSCDSYGLLLLFLTVKQFHLYFVVASMLSLWLYSDFSFLRVKFSEEYEKVMLLKVKETEILEQVQEPPVEEDVEENVEENV